MAKTNNTGIERKTSRRVYEPLSLNTKEFRSIFSAQPDDLIFKCSDCGKHRIFGKRLGPGVPPDNQTPLLNCHNVRVHKEVKLAKHVWVDGSAVLL